MARNDNYVNVFAKMELINSLGSSDAYMRQ